MENNLAGAIATSDQVGDSQSASRLGRTFKKTITMYAAMVTVSTGAIFLLEHATILSAFRTALVAAVGKTFAANWVSSIFE